MRAAISIAIPVGLALMGGALLWQRTAPELRIEPPPSPATHGDFTVETASGALSLSSLRGRAVVVYFGYTACPDICPTTLAALRSAFAQLEPEERQRSTVLFVSVDPKRDAPERLAEYVAYFDPTFRAGTADPETLDAIARDWGVTYRYVRGSGSALDYLVDHSTPSYLVAPDGRMVEIIDHGTPPAEIAAAIRRQL